MDQVNITDILIEFTADGGARVSWREGTYHGCAILPAEVAEKVLNVQGAIAAGVKVAGANESHEKAQRAHAEQMQRAGDRSNDAFMLAGRR
jgi:hypothetical protein